MPFQPGPAGSTFTPTRKGVDPDVRRIMRELLEAGVHFGHQTRRWNPKMRRFIFTDQSDAASTSSTCNRRSNSWDALAFARNLAERGGSVLFVGTKKQSQSAVEEQAKRVGMPYVSHRCSAAADELAHHLRPDRPPARAPAAEGGRTARPPAGQGAYLDARRAREARREPRRRRGT